MTELLADAVDTVKVWRAKARAVEEASYKRNVADLDAYVREHDGMWPRLLRAPGTDEEIRASQLARFVRRYGHEIAPWQADVLCAFPIVQRVFGSLSRRVALPVTASTVHKEAPSPTEEEVAALMGVSPDEENSAVGDIVPPGGYIETSADDEATERVLRQSDDFRMDLDAAIDRALEFYATGNERLGAEFFMVVFYYGRFEGSHNCSMGDCRAYIRYRVWSGFYQTPTTTMEFFSGTGLAAKNVESLMATALSESADAPDRFFAIRTLLRFFHLSP